MLFRSQAIMLPQTEMYSKESREKYGLVTAWRIMPRAFGKYRFGNEDMVSVECEEIITATNTMSFDDYLECREMNLFVEIFHNGSPFREVRNIVRGLGGEWFDFLHRAFQHRLDYPALKAGFEEFKQASVDKYWPSKQALTEYVEGNIDSMLADTRGSNEMARAKSTAFFRTMNEMHHLMYDSLESYIQEVAPGNRPLLDFIADLKRFSFLRKVSLQNTGKIFHFDSEWDFSVVDEPGFTGPVKKPGMVTYEIFHDVDQQTLLNDHISFQGKTIDGLSRMIMFRVNYDKIFRSSRCLSSNKVESYVESRTEFA